MWYCSGKHLKTFLRISTSTLADVSHAAAEHRSVFVVCPQWEMEEETCSSASSRLAMAVDWVYVGLGAPDHAADAVSPFESLSPPTTKACGLLLWLRVLWRCFAV